MGDGVGSRLDFFVSFFGNEKKKKAELKDKVVVFCIS
jgi:hypothetical protein